VSGSGRHRHREPRAIITGWTIGYFEDGPNFVTMAMNGWGDADLCRPSS
jgi:hypothetical protein